MSGTASLVPSVFTHHHHRELRLWLIYEQEFNAAMAAEANVTSAAQQREMALGIRSMKFQYLHLLIMLLRDDPRSCSLRIASAREALSLLPDMVSNWGSVYNGIVWWVLPSLAPRRHLAHCSHLQATTLPAFQPLFRRLRGDHIRLDCMDRGY